eukprot:1653313-Rhodomonas_salina.2
MMRHGVVGVCIRAAAWRGHARQSACTHSHREGTVGFPLRAALDVMPLVTALSLALSGEGAAEGGGGRASGRGRDNRGMEKGREGGLLARLSFGRTVRFPSLSRGGRREDLAVLFCRAESREGQQNWLRERWSAL